MASSRPPNTVKKNNKGTSGYTLILVVVVALVAVAVGVLYKSNDVIHQQHNRQQVSHLSSFDMAGMLGVEVIHIPVFRGDVDVAAAEAAGDKEATRPLKMTILCKATESAESFEEPAEGEEEEGRRKRKNPVVLMLHGFPDDAATFFAQLDTFADAGKHHHLLTLFSPLKQDTISICPLITFILPFITER